MTKDQTLKSSDIQEAVQQLKKPFIVEMKAEIKAEKERRKQAASA